MMYKAKEPAYSTMAKTANTKLPQVKTSVSVDRGAEISEVKNLKQNLKTEEGEDDLELTLPKL